MTISTLSKTKPLGKTSVLVRYFHTAAAALLVLAAFGGFYRFYLHGKAYPGMDLPPPIRTLLIIHGSAMAAWMILFMLQPMLIASRNHRVHMKLGWVATGLALCVTVIGCIVAVAAAKVNPPGLKIFNLPPNQFLAVPLLSILSFAIFVTIGILKRRKPAAHRAMLLLGTLIIISAALNRIDWVNSTYAGTIWARLFGPFFASLVIGASLLLIRLALTRSFDRWYTMGYICLVVVSWGIFQIAPTQAWQQIAGFLMH